MRRVEKVSKRTLWGYNGDDWTPFLKLTICEPRDLPKVRGAFERGEISYQGLFDGIIKTYESNIVYPLRFMIDTHVVGMNWIEVPAGKYNLIDEKKKKTTCQIEIDVPYASFSQSAMLMQVMCIGHSP